MEVSPATTAKRTRTKVTAAPAAADSEVKKKKTRARKQPAEATTAAPAPQSVAATAPNDEELHGMIATAAYFLAADRNFVPGRELDDWLVAERLIRTQVFSTG
jgi:hypothetical protein